MATVVNQSVELYSILKTFRDVANDDGLTNTQRVGICGDLRKSIPARAMCGQCMNTYDIVMAIISTKLEGLRDELRPVHRPAPTPEPPKAEAPKAKTKARRKVKGSKK